MSIRYASGLANPAINKRNVEGESEIKLSLTENAGASTGNVSVHRYSIGQVRLAHCTLE